MHYQIAAKHVSFLALSLFVLVSMPGEAEAQSRERYSRIDTRSLDDEIVESIPIPILFGVEYVNVRSDFGDPRGGGTRSHEGQDLMAPKGAPIVSPTAAIVTRVGEGDSAGLYVYTANPGGETFRYMHLDTIADIRTGTKLKAGDLIGTVGNTGNASGGAAHLHFEIRKDGRALDPYPRLDGNFTFKEKISFLDGILDDFDGSAATYAQFLVATYPAELKRALADKLSLPRTLTQAMTKAGIVDTSSLQEKLDALIDSIPSLLTKDLMLGSSGPEVALLQFFLMSRMSVTDSAGLRAAGATGYFGSVTEAALRAYQRSLKVPETGVFDAATRSKQ
jgi:hypothetical protein